MTAAVLADLFDPAPATWGLRGDPVLWDALRADFAATPLPDRADTLVAEVAARFQALTSAPLDTTAKSVLVPAFAAHGPGMSAGHISPVFWRDTVLPLLVTRLAGALMGRGR